MRPILLAVLLVLAACAEQAPSPQQAAAPPTECTAHEPEFRALIGMTEAEVRGALGTMPGIRSVRSGAPNAPMTSDFRIDRATIVVSRGRVIRIGCG